MNKAEKCEFISCAGVLSCIFLASQKHPGNHHILLVMANCHYILDSFPDQPTHMQQAFTMG